MAVDACGELGKNEHQNSKDTHHVDTLENAQPVQIAQPDLCLNSTNDDSFGSEAVSLLSVNDEEDLVDEFSHANSHAIVDEYSNDGLLPNSTINLCIEEGDLQTSVDES